MSCPFYFKDSADTVDCPQIINAIQTKWTGRSDTSALEALSFWLPLGSAELHFSPKNIGHRTKAHWYPISLVTGETVEPLLHFSRSHPASMQGRPSFPFPCPPLPPLPPLSTSSNELLLEFVRSLHLSLLLFFYAPADICDGERAGFYPKVDPITNSTSVARL